jgi:hypothetical protein
MALPAQDDIPDASTRGAARRALDASLVVVITFAAFALATTQIPWVRARSPWAADPWDAVVSFTIQLVGVVAVVTWIRAQAYRRRDVDVAGLRGILRGCDVCLGAIAITVAADIAGLARGAKPAVSDGSLAWFVVAVVAVGVVTVIAAIRLVHAWRLLGHRQEPALRAGRDPVAALSAWAIGHGPATLRRHPDLLVVAAAVMAGLTLSAWHTLAEGVMTNGAATTLIVTAIYAGIEILAVLILGLAAARYLRLLPPPR